MVSLIHRLWRSDWHRVFIPPAKVFAAVVKTRRHLYDQAVFKSIQAPVPTFSVGGLEAGGSGKTPVVAWVLRSLLDQGQHPGLLTRGYGRRRRDLRVRSAGSPADPAAIGDEAAMLVASGLDVPVAAVANRSLGARALLGHACTSLVLDDGFSHRALRRQLDMVVLRAEQPFGNGQLLPAGSLREPPDSLSRAQVVWLMDKSGSPGSQPLRPAWLTALCPDALVVHSSLEPAGAFTTGGQSRPLSGRAVVAVAGIARPDDFFGMVQAQGADIKRRVRLADHQDYTPNRARDLLRLAREASAQLITTAKDAVKLAPLLPAGQELLVFHVRLEIHHGQRALLAAIRACLLQFGQQPGGGADSEGELEMG
jgi:tetraacyldisaccharide 4'-kinase